MAKILVADDKTDILDMIGDILRAHDHEVVAVANGGEVLGRVKEEKPDLLILDVLMPEFDGFSIQTEISRDAMLLDLPVVVISAYKAYLGFFSRFRQVTATLGKPFESFQLMAAVENALERGR